MGQCSHRLCPGAPQSPAKQANPHAQLLPDKQELPRSHADVPVTTYADEAIGRSTAEFPKPTDGGAPQPQRMTAAAELAGSVNVAAVVKATEARAAAPTTVRAPSTVPSTASTSSGSRSTVTASATQPAAAPAPVRAPSLVSPTVSTSFAASSYQTAATQPAPYAVNTAAAPYQQPASSAAAAYPAYTPAAAGAGGGYDANGGYAAATNGYQNGYQFTGAYENGTGAYNTAAATAPAAAASGYGHDPYAGHDMYQQQQQQQAQYMQQAGGGYAGDQYENQQQQQQQQQYDAAGGYGHDQYGATAYMQQQQQQMYSNGYDQHGYAGYDQTQQSYGDGGHSEYDPLQGAAAFGSEEDHAGAFGATEDPDAAYQSAYQGMYQSNDNSAEPSVTEQLQQPPSDQEASTKKSDLSKSAPTASSSVLAKQGPPRKATFTVAPGKVCKVCSKRAYANESVELDGDVYHNSCFRCKSCNGVLTMRGMAKMEGTVYCKQCFTRIFKSTGGRYNFAAADVAKAPIEIQTMSPEQSDADAVALPVRHRTSAWDQKTQGPTAEELEQQRLQRDAENKARQAALPTVSDELKQIAKQNMAMVMEKKQHQEKALEKALDIGGMFDSSSPAEDGGAGAGGASADGGAPSAAGSGDPPIPKDTVNFNNTLAFIKCTPTQRTERFQQLIEGLRTHPDKRVFTCTAAGLDDEFASILAEFLRTNDSVTEVNIENNKITHKGVIAICNALTTNTTLKTLKLLGNVVHNDAAEAVCALVDPDRADRNNTLQKITFKFTQKNHEYRLEKGLRANHALAMKTRKASIVAAT